MFNEENKETHESYGSISASRFSGGCDIFYGSKIPHNRGVEISIKRGHSYRELNKEWFGEDEDIVTVRMTEMQFAEFITGLNSNRVPCTLVRVNGERMENPPIRENERQMFSREFGEHFQNISEQIKTMRSRMAELLEKKSLSKADKEELLRMAGHLSTEVDANTPYIQQSFEKSMDNVVQEAKVDIQTYCYEWQRTALKMDEENADGIIKYIEDGANTTTIDADSFDSGETIKKTCLITV